MRTLSLGASLLLVLAAACGDDGGDDNSNDTNDVTDVTDVSDNTDNNDNNDNTDVVEPDAPPTANCLAPSSLGTVTAAQSQANAGTAPAADIAYVGITDAAEPVDGILILLYSEFGVFPGPVANGTYQLTGDETAFESCGACVIYQVDSTEAAVGAEYMPTSGTLTLTSVTGTITGSLSNVNLAQVDIDPETGATTPNASGCATSITSMDFTATIMPETRTANGGTLLRVYPKPARH